LAGNKLLYTHKLKFPIVMHCYSYSYTQQPCGTAQAQKCMRKEFRRKTLQHKMN